MGTYDRQVATAERLIREKGKPVQIVRQTTTTTPGKPWEPGVPGEETDDAFAVFLNLNQQDMETMSKVVGASEIQASDRKVLIGAAALSQAPTTQDKLVDEDGEWSIENVQVLAPSGQDILYTLRARK